MPIVPTDLSFNTAVSFLTNTNWQAYSGKMPVRLMGKMPMLRWQPSR
jgi:K+-transporting ATPase ATPase A chain